MTILPPVPAPRNRWLPLVLITILTLAFLIFSIVLINLGQGLIFIPIIFACMYYVKRGFVFSVILVCVYSILTLSLSHDPNVLLLAVIRVPIFILVAGVITYLSLQKIRGEETLRESEERYRSLYADSRDAVMIVSPTRGFLAANPATVRLFACQNEHDFTSQTPMSLSPEYQPDGVRSEDKAQEMMHLALKKGSHFFEWTHRKMNGPDFPATVLLSRLERSGTQILQATVRDITEHKLNESIIARKTQELLAINDELTAAGEELSAQFDALTDSERMVRESEEKYRLLIENSHDIIYTLTPNGIFTFVSPSWTALLGHPVNEVE